MPIYKGHQRVSVSACAHARVPLSVGFDVRIILTFWNELDIFSFLYVLGSRTFQTA